MTLLAQAKRTALVELAVDLRDHARRPGEQRDLWQDYLHTARTASFLREKSAASNGKRALLIAFGVAGQTKLECMLLAGLRHAGWSTAAFTSRATPWVRRYLNALGVAGHVLRQDFAPDPETEATCRREALDYLAGDLSFRAVKQWTYRGVRVGAPLLSNIQRRDRLGSPDPSDPAVAAELHQLLPRILSWVRLCERMLDRARPDLMLLIEANDWNTPLVDLAVARGIDTIQFIQPNRDDALALKRLTAETRRFHPNSLDRSTLVRLAGEPWTPTHERELEQEFADRYGGRWFLQSRNQPGTRLRARDELRAELGLAPGRKSAVVFSHILWDANLFYGTDLFEDYGDWLVQTVRAAVANPALDWLVKLHPANLWKRAYENDRGELAELAVLRRHGFDRLPPHVRLLRPETDISTLSLFQTVDYGITVRGTTGLELPCFGIPTLTAGTGRYSGLGFTRDFDDKQDYLAALARLHEVPPMSVPSTVLAKRHAHALFRRRPWLFKSFRSVFRPLDAGAHPLTYNFELQARSWAEIDANRDLAQWADWASDPARPVDYVGGERG
jgi:hypothetical protein